MTPLLVRPEAEADVEEAFIWYKQKSDELAESFLQILEDSFLSIQENPFGYPRVYKNMRRFVMPKFPYNIIYLLEEGLLETGEFGETVIVFAVIHAKQNPQRWQRRVD